MLQWTASQAENGCKIQDSYDDETGNNMLQLKLVKPKTREDCRIGQVLNGEVLKYGLDEIEDEEMVHTSSGTEKSLTKQTKGEPHNLDFTIGNGIIPITCE